MKDRIIALWKMIEQKYRGFSREKIGRIGWYAGLALLLVVISAASGSWRKHLAIRYDRYAGQSPQTISAGADDGGSREAVSQYDPKPLEALTALPQPSATPEPMTFEWPIPGEIIGPYSPDELIWSETLDQWQTHPALDLAAEAGEAVCACAAGVVTEAWEDALWGKVIRIEHDQGYVSTYANLNTLKQVSVGEAVREGQAISTVGDSAICESEMPGHIHFSLEKDGEPVDFEAFMRSLGES